MLLKGWVIFRVEIWGQSEEYPKILRKKGKPAHNRKISCEPEGNYKMPLSYYTKTGTPKSPASRGEVLFQVCRCIGLWFFLSAEWRKFCFTSSLGGRARKVSAALQRERHLSFTLRKSWACCMKIEPVQAWWRCNPLCRGVMSHQMWQWEKNSSCS